MFLAPDFKDLTNEALSRDKEARKQHAFCLLKAPPIHQTSGGDTPPPAAGGVALRPHETKTVTIYLQAPLQKGQCDLKLLIYYCPTGDISSPKIKYRLVRHVWHLNVNESLSFGVNCNIGNMQTNQLGLDVSICNLNQVHHSLMTEIVPNHLTLYCPAYQLELERRPIYMQSPGQQRLLVDAAGLRTAESISLRVSLTERPAKDSTTTTNQPLEFIQRQLSGVQLIGDAEESEAVLPGLNQLGSFLMKNETRYIGVLGQTGNNEEFNNIVSQPDRHMTIALSWRAVISDNSSMQRTAYGQHFVQLRFLYDT